MFVCEFYCNKKDMLIIVTLFGERANACMQG